MTGIGFLGAGVIFKEGVSVQGLTTADQRGFPVDAAADLGAVETQATTVTTGNVTIPYSAGARNVSLTATVSPARGATNPGSFTFNAAGVGSVGTSAASPSASLATLKSLVSACANSGKFGQRLGHTPGRPRMRGQVARVEQV